MIRARPPGPGRSQGAGEVVRRSQWKNAEWQTGFDQSRRRGVQRAVTAADDHAVDGVGVALDHIDHLVRRR